MGQHEYRLVGVPAEPLSLRLAPARSRNQIQLGEVQVVGSLNSDGALTGRWQSTIGTEGIFSIRRFNDSVSAELPKKNSVFLVHGHDDGAKHGAARFIEQLGLTPVILQEQINRGMALIEKFEDFAGRAGFAFVLITPDDVGYPVNAEQEKKHRPRQNVVLELGFFAGKIGRDKTFVLVKGDVEMRPTSWPLFTNRWIGPKAGSYAWRER